MNIKVNVEVRFESGAAIKLTDHQTIQVSKYVEEVIFGVEKVNVVKKTKVHKNIYRPWTDAEVAMVQELAYMPRNREKREKQRQIAILTKRTRAAVSQKATEIRQKSNKNIITVAGDNAKTNWVPLEQLRHNYLGN